MQLHLGIAGHSRSAHLSGGSRKLQRGVKRRGCVRNLRHAHLRFTVRNPPIFEFTVFYEVKLIKENKVHSSRMETWSCLKPLKETTSSCILVGVSNLLQRLRLIFIRARYTRTELTHLYKNNYLLVFCLKNKRNLQRGVPWNPP